MCMAKISLIALLFKAQIIPSNLLVSFFPSEIIHCGKVFLSQRVDEPAKPIQVAEVSAVLTGR